MPGTQRKTTIPRKAQPKPKPAEPAVEVDRFDLMEELAVGDGDEKPEPITFRGVDADIRQSYEGEDVCAFWLAIDQKDFPAALTVVAGDAGQALWEKIGPLKPDLAARILNKIFDLSKLHEGELIASLPTSFVRMAGAQRTPDSGTTTS